MPCILVGTKSDLRFSADLLSETQRRRCNDNERHKHSVVSFAEGCQMAQEIQASKYVECSSLEFRGLQEVFDEAVRAAIKRSQK